MQNLNCDRITRVDLIDKKIIDLNNGWASVTKITVGATLGYAFGGPVGGLIGMFAARNTLKKNLYPLYCIVIEFGQGKKASVWVDAGTIQWMWDHAENRKI